MGMSFWARNRDPILAFVIALVAYAVTAGPQRLSRPSRDPHFILQAQAWLDGRLDVPDWPRGADDPAQVETVTLASGDVARGRRLTSKAAFRTTDGRDVPMTEVTGTRGKQHYVSFPPFPAAVMLPWVAVAGRAANDVIVTVVLAALIPALFLVLLRRMREAGLVARPPADDRWLALMLAFGTVLYFSAVQGKVWFTAHVIGVLLCVVYAWASVEARHPVVAGLALVCAFLTRAPMLFMAPLFLLEAWRVGAWRLRTLVAFAAPVAVLGLAAAWHNYARFGNPTEFGHVYLNVRQQAQIESQGLFDWSYLSRNLAVAFALIPDFSARAPYVSISGHGLALWFTTPAFLLLLWPRERNAWHRILWITVACVAPFSLFYQNSGWVQFGYRFSLDYTVWLVLLLAVGGRPLTRPVRALILAGVLVNLVGAATFDRSQRVVRYRTSAADYSCVIAH